MMADLKTLADLVGGELIGSNANFNSVSTDTRNIDINALFVALKGENFDGNDFVSQAQESGATGALVSKAHDENQIGQVVVKDTLKAMQEFSVHWRQQFEIPVVGITGTNGKTTTKTMLTQILSQAHTVHATHGNFNNHIGVPLTLLELREAHQFSVVEMGANKRAEIGDLTKMVKPKIGIITNTSPAHLDGFSDFEGVVRTKGELFQNLANDSVAIINAESRGSLFLSKLAKHCEQINFGFGENTDVRVSEFRTEVVNGSIVQLFRLRTPSWVTDIEMSLLGSHNALNAAAAAAAAHALGIEREDIVAGLKAMHPVHSRFNLHELGSGGWLIDDCYNANPASMRAAIDTADQLTYPLWFVMGDMFEMGDGANEHHAAIGTYAKTNGVDRIYATGKDSQSAVKAFGENARWFRDKDELIMQLNQDMAAISDPVTVLVKASRGMQFEKIVKEVNKHFIEATGQYRRLDIKMKNNKKQIGDRS
jgi:UDP-N-acetylmuramoyl-tripeptide--D-alanyl-D-alanine ligase